MSNGLSQAEIDALLRGDGAAGGETPADNPMMTAPSEEQDPNHTMSAEEIAAAFAAAASGGEELDSDSSKAMSPEEIAAAFAATDAAPAQPEPVLTDDDIAQLAQKPDQEAYEPGKPIKEYEGYLTPVEVDAMGEIGNISMGTSATTLFALLNRRVDITTPRVSVTTMSDIAKVYPLPFVAVEVQYTTGLEGVNVLFLQERDVKIITDLMLGGDGTNIDAPLNEMHMSCISEVMNQMIGSASTSLSKLLNYTIDISPPQSYSVHLGMSDVYPFTNMEDIIVRTAFNMVVEGLINSEIMQVTPVSFAKSMVASMMGEGALPATSAAAAMPQAAPPPPPPPAPAAQAAPPPPPPPPPLAPAPAAAAPPPPYGDPAAYAAAYAPPGYPPQPAYPGYPPQPAYPGYPPPQQPYPGYPPVPAAAPAPGAPPAHPAAPPSHVYDYKAMKYQSFDEGGALPGGENMELLMDVPLSVSVELGKSRKYIKEIVDFNIGSIIVLDKMAGELVDVVVNGKLIAKGEVVVIDENYGVRITDIVSPSKRISAGQG